MRTLRTLTERIEDLTQSERFKALAAAKRKFVRAYMESNGDKVASGKATSNLIKSDKSALNATYKMLRDPVVISLLRTFGEFDFKEPLVTNKELIALTSARLRDGQISTEEFIRLTTLFQDLMEKKKTRKKPKTEIERIIEVERQQ